MHLSIKAQIKKLISSRANLMELLHLFDFFTFFLFLAILFATVKEWTRYRKVSPKKKLPPGPPKLPIIGNLHQLIGKLPHHALTDLAREKYGHLMHVQLGEVSAVIVSSPRLAREIMKTHDSVFADRWKILVWWFIGYDGLDFAFAPYGDYWRQMRKICVRDFLNNKNVSLFSSIRQEEFSKLVASLHSQGEKPIDFTEKMLSCTNAILTRAAFGKAFEDRKKFTELLKEIFAAGGGFDFPDLFPSWRFLLFLLGKKRKLLRMRNSMDSILDTMINEHVENLESAKETNQQENLIDVLLRARESGDTQIPITNNSIKAVLFDMFAGGTETSSTIVEWAMSELLKKPEVMAKAQREIRQTMKGKKTVHDDDLPKFKYLNLVVKETLRLHPPAPFLLPRESLEDREIDGYYIPTGSKIFVNVWAIGRDGEYWPDPESFIPERFENNPIDFKGNDFEYLPFGAGRRICPAISFGVANVELPLALLLYHFNWKLPAGHDLDMEEILGLTATRKHHLRLVATPIMSPRDVEISS